MRYEEWDKLESKFFERCKENFNNTYKEYADILSNSIKYLKAENIDLRDKIFVNVGNRDFFYAGSGSYHPKLVDRFNVINNKIQYKYCKSADCKGIETKYVDVFIISNKYFVKLSINNKGIIDRVEHIIKRDVKKLNIVGDNMLEIYFHGLFDPEVIVLDSYDEALKLQRHITQLRA